MPEQKTYTCIVCPRGCAVTVSERDDGTLDVSGHSCRRGFDYAKSEHVHPVRTLTTTVRLEGSTLRRLPVVSEAPIPKDLLLDCVAMVNRVVAHAPVRAGQVILANVCGTGVDVVAGRDAACMRE